MLPDIVKSKLAKLVDMIWSGGTTSPIKIIEKVFFLLYLRQLEEESWEFSSRPWTALKESYFENDLTEYLFNEVFHESLNGTPLDRALADTIIDLPGPEKLRLIITLIDDIYKDLEDNNAENRMVSGILFEYLLPMIIKPQGGQYVTPRPLIEEIINIMSPKPDERIVDPVCGTGGFLTAIQRYLQKDTQNLNLTGYDIDGSMARIAYMNLLLHGIKSPEVSQFNTLSQKYVENEQYEIVLMNPPFGKYDGDLSYRFSPQIKKSELLFVYLAIDLMVPGGRAAIVVPAGTLFTLNNDYINLRKALIEENILDAVISIPSELSDYSTGVKTFILFVTKPKEKQRLTEKVWFYEIENKGSITSVEAIGELTEKWGQRDDGLFVSVNDLRNNEYSLLMSLYQTDEKEEVNEEKNHNPVEILYQIMEQEKEIENDFRELLSCMEEKDLNRERRDIDNLEEKRNDFQSLEEIGSGIPGFFRGLSRLQEKLINVFYEIRSPLACHEAVKYVNNKYKLTGEDKLGVQEAKQSIELFQAFGLLERVGSDPMCYPKESSNALLRKIEVFDQEQLIDLWKVPSIEKKRSDEK
ncbi:N-6 DNA methylase [Bacillus cereus]|uniref:N-6 DNA methylase n=1 Tax=Bacillus cereus group TaxID=86661 RepID=UPI0018D181A1|nr:N-6 DNA methylase [Bacillus cereus]MBH0318453.1 N-6 DNA methylase [Bacillus cereus]